MNPFKRILWLLVLFALGVKAQQSQKLERPKLIVGIVIDQMKMEYLYRFNDDFSNSGFKKLMKGGFVYHNTHLNYMPTYTACGHASIYTGATPAVHGIVGNEWFSKKLGKDIYCTDDASVKLIGSGIESEGAMSPKRMQTTTITDELKLATNFKAKVFGISLKDRGAILPAGHFADMAFWMSKTGAFISSTFYSDKLPDWATKFNDEKHYMPYIDGGWQLYKPIETYNESLADNNPYEGKLFNAAPVFPYNLKEMFLKYDAGIIKSTPFGNNIILDFAKTTIENESLGKDAVTDFLTLSLSSPDYIGHTIGPRSIELQDTYLRLDDSIADFLNYLDKKVGTNNYLIFLTADHAVTENANFLKDKKYDVKNIEPKTISEFLKKYSVDTFGTDLILDYSNFNIYFKLDEIANKNLDLKAVKQSFKNFLLTQDYIKSVFTEDEIAASNGTNLFLNMIANGYDVLENGQLIILEKPGYMEYKYTGTTHGTPYSYDSHIPLIFYGWKIAPGESFERKTVTEIAPTLAQKLKTELPNGSDGSVLIEILKSN